MITSECTYSDLCILNAVWQAHLCTWRAWVECAILLSNKIPLLKQRTYSSALYICMVHVINVLNLTGSINVVGLHYSMYIYN